jgi:hypothetical protein
VSTRTRGVREQDSDDVRSGPVETEREILRQASVALSGRVVTLWEISARGEVVPRLSSVTDPPYHATVLDVEGTLVRWRTPLAPGARWVGCRLSEQDWCVAPVRREPAAPPPGGVERRSRERMTLELAGLCVGATEMGELLEHDTWSAHVAPPLDFGLADPATVALASLKLAAERIEAEAHLDSTFRAMLLDELAAVGGGLELSRRRGASLEARLVGSGLSFDPAEIAQASVVLERPAARRRGVVLHLVCAASCGVVRGDASVLSYALRSLIRCAVARSQNDAPPVVVRIDELPDAFRVSVEEGAAPDRRTGTGDPMGSRRGVPDLPLLRRMIHETCGGRIELHPLAHGGRAAAIVLVRGSCERREPVGAAN